MDPSKPILVLIVQIGLILALSRVMGLLFARLRQPQVVGEMAAGIMLGPSLLGWLAPQAQRTLFPAESIELLHILAELGVIFFLFLMGLEFDPGLIRKRGRAALVISASSIIVPFAIGVLLTYLLYPHVFNDPRHRRFLSAALFMGAAISITAFPVLARIISERNMHRTSVGAIAITAAAVNDVLAWCMLAVVVAVASFEPSRGRWTPLITFALAGGYVLLMFFGVKPLLRRIQRAFETRGRLSQNLVALIFLFILASSYATQRIGIHALFGAFVMGLVMPKGHQFVRVLGGKIEDFVVIFMLPIFFAYAGLSTDLHQILRADLLGFTALIVVGACIGKIGGTMLGSRACGVSWRESGALGVLMNTRGLMELIILTIGLQQGIISHRVFAMMVIMALVTTALTTPLLHWVYPHQVPAGAAAGATQGYTILVPLSLPESGPSMARLAAALVGSDPARGRALALHLRRASTQEAYHSDLEQSLGAEDTPLAPLTPMLAQAVKSRLVVEPISFVSRDVADDICAVAQARDVDLVLMGFHKPVFGQTILGGTVHRVLERCKCDIAIFVDRGFEQTRRILVPFMGRQHDQLALELASRLARHIQAQVTVLHVIHGPTDRTKLQAKAAVERVFEDPTQPAPVTFRVVEDPSPVDVVLREAPNFDLIVIGATEEWGLESHLIGWRPERIARESPGSLLMVRKVAPVHSAPARVRATADAAGVL